MNGGLVDVELTVVPVTVEDATLFVGTIRDIKDHAVRDTALSENHESSRNAPVAPLSANLPDHLVDDELATSIIRRCVSQICDDIGWPLGHGLLVDELGRQIRSREFGTAKSVASQTNCSRPMSEHLSRLAKASLVVFGNITKSSGWLGLLRKISAENCRRSVLRYALVLASLYS